ncbi:MAG: hypothetical protein KDK07_23940 [Bauldia sp.]|nr:hypothetical protein [Bauldia sp.]
MNEIDIRQARNSLVRRALLGYRRERSSPQPARITTAKVGNTKFAAEHPDSECRRSSSAKVGILKIEAAGVGAG